MRRELMEMRDPDRQVEVISVNTVIVGSGAAGLNAADSLHTMGQRDIALVTEGMNMGTSRNTGSDKQTYYKLTLAGAIPDSVEEMAQTLFDGGSMQGDLALVEAALSTRAFFKLVEIGVPFPHNGYGEYVGYKTDHDPRQRATSAGPLTSRYMTEKLEEQVREKGIPVFDRHLVVGILTAPGKSGGKEAVGLAALNLEKEDGTGSSLVLFNCTNIIYATGGPAGMYLDSVYPESQTGSMGIAFEAGVRGVNLTESQYGIASLALRWNLSGTYQQVIPRYVSTDGEGHDEKEFLEDYFEDPGKMLDAIFLKGYQWPFDPRKVEKVGSSLIDLLVYQEKQIKGRRVFLDYTRNPACGSRKGEMNFTLLNEMDFTLLGQEAFQYLEKSGALFGKPIDRLEKMNGPAVTLYRDHGIDLNAQYLEIGVCAQHNNGGLQVNPWYESNLAHFFPVGEAAGVFGVYRPGGAALNSTQVGSLRAAQCICAEYSSPPPDLQQFSDSVYAQIAEILKRTKNFSTLTKNEGLDAPQPLLDLKQIRKRAGERMTRAGAHIREYKSVCIAMEECRRDMETLSSGGTISGSLPDMFRLWDVLVTQLVYLYAIRSYMERGGGSRGGYLILDPRGRLPNPKLPSGLRFRPDDGVLMNEICEVEYRPGDKDEALIAAWKPVRLIPERDNWFEQVWREYREGMEKTGCGCNGRICGEKT